MAYFIWEVKVNVVGIVIDVAIVLVLLITGLIGIKKGFLKSLLSLFNWVVCLGASIWLAKYVANWVGSWFGMENAIAGKISNAIVGSNAELGNSVASFGSKDAIMAACAGMNGLLKQLINIIFSSKNVDFASETAVSDVASAGVAHICVLAISAVLLFIVIKIVLAILGKLFDNIARTRVLGSLNRVLGFVFGVVKGGCIVVIFNIVAVALSLVPMINNTIIKPVIQDNTKVEKVIYQKTDEIVGKYVIEGKMIQTWIDNLWENR